MTTPDPFEPNIILELAIARSYLEQAQQSAREPTLKQDLANLADDVALLLARLDVTDMPGHAL